MLTAIGCGGKDKSDPSPKPTPTPTRVPIYTIEQVERVLLSAHDLGKDWTKEEVPSAYKERKVRGCSESKITLTGDPETRVMKFGAPKFATRGANYAQLVAVYENEDEADAAMEAISQKLSKCPKSKKIKFKQLPDDKFIYQHDDTWSLDKTDLGQWIWLRAREKSVYPRSVSDINVFHFSIDYAQRGNVVLTSMYWQRKTPKDSGDPIAEKATEILKKQLERFE
ncbi:hypothetical protein [Actinocorallia aurea]